MVVVHVFVLVAAGNDVVRYDVDVIVVNGVVGRRDVVNADDAVTVVVTVVGDKMAVTVVIVVITVDVVVATGHDMVRVLVQ